MPRAVILLLSLAAVSAAVGVHAQSWCSIGSSLSTSSFAACRAGTESGPSSISCSSGGVWNPPGYALATCPVTPTACSDISVCSSCTASTLNCGYCFGGSVTASCMPAGSSCSGQQFVFTASSCPATTNCGSNSDCGTCNAMAGCAWCDGSNTCGLDSVCTSTSCSSPPPPSDDPADDDPPGSFDPISSGDGKRYFYPGSPRSDSNSRAAIPLLTFTLIAFIAGLILVSCVGSFAPKAASKVGQVGMLPRLAANRVIVVLALIAECVVFLLILVALGVNTWSIYTTGTGSRQSTLAFGVYSVTVSQFGAATYTAWYSCDLADGASDDYKKQCGAFLGGCVLTMFYEMFFGIAGLVACVMIALGVRNQRYSSGMFKAHAIATVAVVAALFNWALAPHLILTSELKAAEDQNSRTGSLGFGPSWGLLIPIFIFALALGMLWRAAVETLPLVAPGAAGAVPAAGLPVASPQQFGDAQQVPLEQNPYLAQQQMAQQQAQFAPQQQYPVSPMPAAYAPQPYPAVQPGADPQQGMGAGYVGPEASTGGFAQI